MRRIFRMNEVFMNVGWESEGSTAERDDGQTTWNTRNSILETGKHHSKFEYDETGTQCETRNFAISEKPTKNMNSLSVNVKNQKLCLSDGSCEFKVFCYVIWVDPKGVRGLRASTIM